MSEQLPDRLRPTLRKLIRFLAVGGSFSLFYAVSTALLVGQVGLPAFATSVVVYALCIPAAFLVQRHVTFGAQGRKAVGFAIYATTQVTSLAIVAAVTTRFVTGVFVLDTLVFLATAGAAAVVSYVICDRFAFRPEA